MSKQKLKSKLNIHITAFFSGSFLTQIKVGEGEQGVFSWEILGSDDKEKEKEFSDWITNYCENRTHGELSCWKLALPAFTVKVLHFIYTIPFGKVMSYGEVAAAVGCPSGGRAVGNALSKNPLLILVPCHRIIRAEGTMGGFTAGLPLKEKLLSFERTTV